MSITAALGLGKGLDGRDAAVAAAQQAISQMGGVRPAVGLVFVSQVFNPAESLEALTNSLPNTIFWGCSTLNPLRAGGDAPRTVEVLLLGGADLQARVYWHSAYSQNSAAAGKYLAQALLQDPGTAQAVFLALDGINGDPGAILAALQPLNIPLAGCLAGGETSEVKTYQISGTDCGSGGLAALVLGKKVRLGLGSAHSWIKTGLYHQITQAGGPWIQAMDGLPPAEIYARAFNFPAREWGFPPLKTTARQIPLGVEVPGSGQTLPYAPLHVEVDGSLRMNVPLRAGQVVHLLAGDPELTPAAASQAARAALENLNGARPLAAVAFVDEAYHLLMQDQPAELYAALRDELAGIPLAAVYTLGQVVPAAEGGAVMATSSISVVVLGAVE